MPSRASAVVLCKLLCCLLGCLWDQCIQPACTMSMELACTKPPQRCAPVNVVLANPML